MYKTILLILSGFFLIIGCQQTEKSESRPKRHTKVTIKGEKFFINGQPTLVGKMWNNISLEGLLPNSRMVQGIFDDLNPETRKKWVYPDTKQWDPDRNTNEFVAAMETWHQHGLLAFTINLQGGSPEGYSRHQPWHNSAIDSVGGLRPAFMQRLEKILNRADELGMVVILGIFYFGQDERLQDEEAVKSAVINAANWILDRNYTNVLIEVANECNNRKYDHEIIKAPRMHELMQLVKQQRSQKHRLLVAASFNGNTIPTANVVRESDFILLHGNGVKQPERIQEMVAETRQIDGYRPMPIVFNEDDHYDFDQPRNNFVAALQVGASWGYFDFRRPNEGFEQGYQSVPVDWAINSPRKKAFFNKLKQITNRE